MELAHDLKGKVAIVTGAGRGIGRAIARRFAAGGAAVTIVSRTPAQIEETRRAIEHAGGRAFAVCADVTKAGDVERIVAETRDLFGRIDVLVNNAGVAPIAKLEQMEPEMFDGLVATNIRAVHLCSRAVWTEMTEGGGGIIVNISSVAAYDPFPGFAAYGASKAFVNAYTKALATEGAERNIRVYAVAPGAVETGMLRGTFPNFPAEKTLAPDDVAALVENLLSPACRYISGQTVVIKKD